VTDDRRNERVAGASALRAAGALALVLALAVSAASAAAAQTEPSRTTGSGSPQLVWNEAWPRLHAWEYVAGGASYAYATQANWTRNFLFDFAFRDDELGARDPSFDLGALAGIGVPVLLHYAMHHGEARDDADSVTGSRGGPRPTAPTRPRFALTPFATAHSLGLGALGRW